MFLYTNKNQDGTYSIKDTVSNTTRHFTSEQVKTFNYPVVGFLRKNGVIYDVHTVEPDDVSKSLVDIINTFPDQDVKNFCNALRRLIPHYIFEVAASSTGKYHPASDGGFGGLQRHMISVYKMFTYIVSIESTIQFLQLTPREIELMQVACLFHDGLKSGWQEDFEKSKYSRFNHPILMANCIRGMEGFLDNASLNFIAHCIETHMGQWVTDSHNNNQVVLPKPSDKYQWLVHLSDYLASRMDLSFDFGTTSYVKYGNTIVEVGKSNPKDMLTSADKESLKKANESQSVIPKAYKDKLDITREDTEIHQIWENILKFGSASEKQKKYVELAKELTK